MSNDSRVKRSSRSVLWVPVVLAAIAGATGPFLFRAAPASADAARGTATDAGDPLMSTWSMQNGGRYARVVQTTGSAPVTTWPSANLLNHGGGQSTPAYSDIQQVSYSADWVYVKGTGLASHQMGPWYDGVNRIFGNWPSNQNYIRRFPRHAKVATTKTTNGGGPLGLWVNGVALFNLLDTFSYSAETGRETPGMGPGANGGLWWRNAVVVEQPTFDASNAHQPESGEYHYHDNPVALRAQLGDNIALDAKTGRYHEDTSRLHHSPILGWSYDGYPIYGPYGYADAKDAKSPIRRIESGFVIRDGAHGTDDLRKTGRHTLGKWAATLHSVDVKLSDDQIGPDVSTRYTLGRYVEDFDYLGDHGAIQGRDFDLDIYNGRFCVTPEFPQGTYAYFVTLNADGSPAFPYALGRQWYGVPSGGQGTKILETVTVFRDAGPNAAKVAATRVGGKSDSAITWSSTEGGHYTLLASTDGQNWKTVATDLKSNGTTTRFSLPSPGTSATRYQAQLTSLDPYDTTGRQMGRGQRRGGPGGGPGGRGQGGEGELGNGPGGQGGPGGVVAQATPAAAKRGETVTVRLTLGDMPPAPPAEIAPLGAKIGTLAAQSVTWDGETVVAKFVVPTGMAVGVADVTVTFPAPPDRQGNLVFTGVGVFVVK